MIALFMIAAVKVHFQTSLAAASKSSFTTLFAVDRTQRFRGADCSAALGCLLIPISCRTLGATSSSDFVGHKLPPALFIFSAAGEMAEIYRVGPQR